MSTVPTLAALGGMCLALGYLIPRNALIAVALAAIFLGVTLVALAGLVRFTAIFMAALPWLILFLDLTPKLTLTLASAMAVVLLLSVTRLRTNVSMLAVVGISLFSVVLLSKMIESTTSEQLIEASKYLLFPAMAAIVCSPNGRQRLVGMRSLMLYSGVAAMTAQAATIVLHLGRAGTYYGAGEQLGLATEGPHELALIGVIVAVACLVSIRDIRWRLIAASIAATPALATGVRSALVALVISLLALAIKARFRPSVVLSIAVISSGIIFSGVGTIIVTRYEQGQARGEYTSFATTGSGRGALWTVTLNQWEASGARGIAFGGGLRSTERIVEQSLGRANTAQSDLVTVLVELGVLGLAAWLLIWLAILCSGINWLVLLPLASYALTNGSLEYVGAVVFGIALAGACTPASRLEPAPVDSSV